jgi:hypothetical protein
LAKSYWEEYVFQRDTSKLLAYYKHVVPGSMSDGDLQVSMLDPFFSVGVIRCNHFCLVIHIIIVDIDPLSFSLFLFS